MTDLIQPGGITDHDLFVVRPYDHHPEVESYKLNINALSIPVGDYEKRITWTRDDHRITWVCLAGPVVLTPGGRLGAYAMGTQVATQSNARFISGAGVYSYVASFSRLHGDSYLTASGTFGTGIHLKDIYLDGNETVLVFEAITTTRSLTVAGLVVAK